MYKNNLYVGTNDFNHTSWCDTEIFNNIPEYDYEQKLKKYSERFNSVELDSSFYFGRQKCNYIKKNIQIWRQIVNKPFLFNVKLPGSITLTYFDKSTLELFWISWWFCTREFKECLGCIVIEIDTDIPFYKLNWIERLEYFSEIIHKTNKDENVHLKIVFEFKHSSFYNETIYHFLRKNNWGIVRMHTINKKPKIVQTDIGSIITCVYDNFEWIDPIITNWSPDVITCNFQYYKLYGPNGEKCGSYSDNEEFNLCLESIEKNIKKNENIFVIMNNYKFPITIEYQLNINSPIIENSPSVADCDSIYNRYPRYITEYGDTNIILPLEKFREKINYDKPISAFLNELNILEKKEREIFDSKKKLNNLTEIIINSNEDSFVYYKNNFNSFLLNNYKNSIIIDEKKFLNVQHYLYYQEYNIEHNTDYINNILSCDTFNKAIFLYNKNILKKNNTVYINKKNKDLGYINNCISKFKHCKKNELYNKKDFMLKALNIKFKDATLKKKLLNTNNSNIIDENDKDNLLGLLLMEIRNNIQI